MLQILLFIFIMTPSAGVANSHDKMLKTWQQGVREVDHFSAKFSKTRFLAKRKRTLPASTGEAFFSRPNLVRWVDHKEQQEWIFDGRHIINIHSANKTGIKTEATSAQGQKILEIMEIVLNVEAVQKKYTIEPIDGDGKQVALRLTPKTGQGGDIKFIDAKLRPSLKMVQSLKIHLSNGNVTTFAFNSPSSAKIPRSKFSTPDGVRVRDLN